jgi:hypothetical protein
VYCRNEPLVKRLDQNGEEVIVTRQRFEEEIPRRGRFQWEEGILGKVRLYWPKIGGVF